MKAAYKLISYTIWKKRDLTRTEITKTLLKENSVILLILHRRSSPSIIPDKYLAPFFIETYWLQQ